MAGDVLVKERVKFFISLILCIIYSCFGITKSPEKNEI